MIRVRFALQALIAIAAVAQRPRREAYPARPIHVIVPYMAGTGVDTLAHAGRTAGQEDGASGRRGEQARASGNIGTEYVAKSPADGYTVLPTSNTFVIVPALANAVPFDPVADFAPVGGVAVGTLAMSSIRRQALSVAELIALAKRSPASSTTRSPGMVRRTISRWSSSSSLRRRHRASRTSGVGRRDNVVSGRVPMMTWRCRCAAVRGHGKIEGPGGLGTSVAAGARRCDVAGGRNGKLLGQSLGTRCSPPPTRHATSSTACRELRLAR